MLLAERTSGNASCVNLCLYEQSLHGRLQTSIDGDDSMGPEDI